MHDLTKWPTDDNLLHKVRIYKNQLSNEPGPSTSDYYVFLYKNFGEYGGRWRATTFQGIFVAIFREESDAIVFKLRHHEVM